ncbi:unnamed protein product, partial [Amoebophrya sp. A25]|eukprot:GSA25T00010683001.1
MDPRLCRLWVSPLDRARWLVLKRMRQEWKQRRAASTVLVGSRKLSVAQFLQGLIVGGATSKP